MAQCAHCQAETELYDGGVAICVTCSNALETKRKLMHYLVEATEHANIASRGLATARHEMMKAHNRLNDYLSRGIVPEDLKRSG